MVLALAAAAALALPTVGVTGEWGTTPAQSGPFCATATDGSVVCGSFPPPWERPDTPVVKTSAGGKLVVSLGQPGMSATAELKTPTAALTATTTGPDAGVLRVTLPNPLPATSYLMLNTAWTGGQASYAVKLLAQPTATATSATLAGSRVRWTLSCPADASDPCAGTTRLSAGGRRLASATFSGLAAGASTTVSAKPLRAVRAGRALRASVARADGHGARTVAQLKLKAR